MPFFYIDPWNGNDSNGGTISQPWKNPSKVTTSNVAPGDEVRIAKSPVWNTGVSATFTNGNNNITLASPVTATIDACDSGWLGVTNSTVTHTTTGAKLGSRLNISIAAGFTTGKIAYKQLASTMDLSAYQQISFWFACSIATLQTTDFTLNLCSDTAGNTVIASRTIAVENVAGQSISTGNFANAWCPITLNFGTALPSNVASISITANRDFGAAVVYVDHIFASKAESANDAITLQSLVGHANSIGAGGNDSEPWFCIAYIDGTTVAIDMHPQSATSNMIARKGYSHTTKTTNLYRLKPVVYPAPQATRNNTHSFGSFGRSGTGPTGMVYYRFGWDMVADTQNGITVFDSLNGGGGDTGIIGVATSNWRYLTLEKFGNVRAYNGGGNPTLIGATVQQSLAVSCAAGYRLGPSNQTLVPAFFPAITVNHIAHCSVGITADNRANGATVKSDLICANVTGVTSGHSGFAVTGAKIWNNTNGVIPAASHFYLFDCDFAANSADIVTQAFPNYFELFLDGCNPTTVTNGVPKCRIYSTRHGGVDGDDRIYNGTYSVIPETGSLRRTTSGRALNLTVTNFSALSLENPAICPLGYFHLLANQQVQFSAWFRRTNASLVSNLVLWGLGRNIPGIGYYAESTVSGTNTYEKVTVTVTPTKPCTVQVMATCYGVNASLYIDDFDVTGLVDRSEMNGLDISTVFGPTGPNVKKDPIPTRVYGG